MTARFTLSGQLYDHKGTSLSRLEENEMGGKKSETELTASILKKDPKHTRGYRECFLIGQNMQIFRRSPLFPSYIQHENRTKTAEFVVVVVVHSLKKEDFLKNSHVLSCLVQLKNEMKSLKSRILFSLRCPFDFIRSL